MSIGDNIKQLRESHGLTQTELGQIAGVTDKAVSTWEADLKVPRMGAVQKMADYFQIPKSVILDGEIIPTMGQLGKIAKILGVAVSDLIGPNDWQDIDMSDAFVPDDDTTAQGHEKNTFKIISGFAGTGKSSVLQNLITKYGSHLDPNEGPGSDGQVIKLLDSYDHLNDEGQGRLVDYADDLVSSGKYKKQGADEVGRKET